MRVGPGMIYAGLDLGNRLNWLNSGVVSGAFRQWRIVVDRRQAANDCLGYTVYTQQEHRLPVRF
jgi:hypothetical protein